MTEWVRELQREADAIEGGVVTVWHPDATAADIRAATDMNVVEIKADTASEAVRRLREAE